MTLRFYIGGPVAHRGLFFWVAARWHTGCFVAFRAGANIPPDTYRNADRKVSQYNEFDGMGTNDTAILLIEV